VCGAQKNVVSRKTRLKSEEEKVVSNV